MGFGLLLQFAIWQQMAQSLFPFMNMTPCTLNLATLPLVPLSSLTILNQFLCLNPSYKINPSPASLFRKFWNHSLFHLTLSVVIESEWSNFQTDGDYSNPMVAQLSNIAIQGCFNCLIVFNRSFHRNHSVWSDCSLMNVKWSYHGLGVLYCVNLLWVLPIDDISASFLELEGGAGDSTFGKK